MDARITDDYAVFDLAHPGAHTATPSGVEPVMLIALLTPYHKLDRFCVCFKSFSHPSFFCTPLPCPLCSDTSLPNGRVFDDTIMLHQVQHSDTAVYQCQASNSHGSIMANVNLMVLSKCQARGGDWEPSVGSLKGLQCLGKSRSLVGFLQTAVKAVDRVFVFWDFCCGNTA